MQDLFVTVFSNPLVKWVLGLLLANVVVGIASAFYDRTFALAAIADWLLSRALPYVLVAGALQVLVLLALPDYQAQLQGVSTAVWGFVALALIGHILDGLRTMGLPVPPALTDRPKALTSTSP